MVPANLLHAAAQSRHGLMALGFVSKGMSLGRAAPTTQHHLLIFLFHFYVASKQAAPAFAQDFSSFPGSVYQGKACLFERTPILRPLPLLYLSAFSLEQVWQNICYLPMDIN